MSLDDYYESLDQMAATLAHEVKNPLAVVNANLDYIELTDEAKIYEKNVRSMRNVINRMMELLHDYSSLSVPASENMKATSINDMLLEIVGEMKVSCGNACLELKTQDNLKMNCDEEKLRRALQNLIKNSIEAVKETGRPDGYIKLVAAKDDGNLKIILSDNGTGIDAEGLERLRKPFYTTKANGNGLGYHIALNIIKEHGGSVSIKSEKNSGTEITIDFPNIREC